MTSPELQDAVEALLATTPLPSVTPIPVVFESVVDQNIAAVISRLGSPRRWRPHIKTARAQWTIERMVKAGITAVKASTVQEATTALAAGVPDVMLAFPAVAGRLNLVGRVAALNQGKAKVSALVDSVSVIDDWPSGLDAFVDLDVGMERTGFPVQDDGRVLAAARRLRKQGIRFRGLHVYDGHLGALPEEERAEAVRAWLGRVIEIANLLERNGQGVEEIVVGGTQTLSSLLASDLESLPFRLTLGPGTLVYADLTTLERTPSGFVRAAYVVLTTVVSRPTPRRITVDAGLTAIQVDQGSPHCEAIGWSGLRPLRPSQEHLPFDVKGKSPKIGSVIALLPRHVDTSISQFSQLLVSHQDGTSSIEPLPLRGISSP